MIVSEEYDETTKKKTKTWGTSTGMKWTSNDAKSTAASFMAGFAILWTILMAFAVIL